MANPWFRFYAEFATDPKVQFMSEPLQRRYVFALCVTCNGEIEKVTEEELAYAMRITTEEWQDTKRIFIERGLFTADGKVANWQKRQYKCDVADPTNKERQQRYRANKRNGSVTEEKRDVTEEKRPDTDTDKEKNRAKRFAPPTLDEVAAYCAERGKGVNPDKWYNHYSAKNWMIGKNKMVDWKAAVRTWEPEDKPAVVRERRFEL